MAVHGTCGRWGAALVLPEEDEPALGARPRRLFLGLESRLPPASGLEEPDAPEEEPLEPEDPP